MSTIKIEAVFENGVFRPVEPLTLAAHQRVTLLVQVPAGSGWPEDVADIYREIADEDRRLAAMMEDDLKKTWPASEGEP